MLGFKVGDRVKLVTTRHGISYSNPVFGCCIGGVMTDFGGTIISTGGFSLPIKVRWDNGRENSYENIDLAPFSGIIKDSIIEKKSTMSIATKFRRLMTSEPEKTFIETGIMNDNKYLTLEGKELFIAFMFEKNKAEFKTEVADKLKEEKE